MHAEEMEKLRRTVERPFGELMFASVVVIGDGATERALLPPLIRHALQGRAHGVCVVDPGSMLAPEAQAVVKFAKLVGVPWFLFADSDSDGRAAATTLAGGDTARIVWVPAEVADGGRGGATELMLHDFDAALCGRVCTGLGLPAGHDVLAFMTKKKGVLGRLIALELMAAAPDPLPAGHLGHLPAAIGELITKLDGVLPAYAAPVSPSAGARA
jgi:hypothetical protein